MTALPLDGTVAMVTGANTGIGKATARELAKRGAHVFLACRSEQRAKQALKEIQEDCDGKAKPEFIALDLADLTSVKRCAENFLARDLPLHLLIANAGLMGKKGKTLSGFELAFGTCHVGHFLLTQLLLGRMKISGQARVVVVASKLHQQVDGIDFDAVRRATRSVSGMDEYSVAKLANVLFVAELARRMEGSNVTCYALHPGVVASDLWCSTPWPLSSLMKMFMLSPEQGAATSLYCATEPALAAESGLYYDECRIATPSRAARDNTLAKKLWETTENWTRDYLVS